MGSHSFASTLFPVDQVNNRKFLRVSTAALLSLSQTGNTEATHCLIARYQELICKIAWRLTANPADAAELISETYLHLFSVLNSCRNADTLPGWIKRITQNVFYRLYNTRRRMRATSLDSMVEIVGDHFLASSDNDPARLMLEACESAEGLRRLQAAVGSLTQSSRSVIDLFYFKEQSYDQIACQTGLQMGTIKSRLFRARKELHRKLGDLFV